MTDRLRVAVIGVGYLGRFHALIYSRMADVDLVGIEDGIVKVTLKGACAGCPMSQMTLKNGIERLLKQEIPEVKSVENVT